MNQKNTLDLNERVKEIMNYETNWSDEVTSPQQIKKRFRNTLRDECADPKYYCAMIAHSASAFAQDNS